MFWHLPFHWPNDVGYVGTPSPPKKKIKIKKKPPAGPAYVLSILFPTLFLVTCPCQQELEAAVSKNANLPPLGCHSNILWWQNASIWSGTEWVISYHSKIPTLSAFLDSVLTRMISQGGDWHHTQLPMESGQGCNRNRCQAAQAASTRLIGQKVWISLKSLCLGQAPPMLHARHCCHHLGQRNHRMPPNSPNHCFHRNLLLHLHSPHAAGPQAPLVESCAPANLHDLQHRLHHLMHLPNHHHHHHHRLGHTRH